MLPLDVPRNYVRIKRREFSDPKEQGCEDTRVTPECALVKVSPGSGQHQHRASSKDLPNLQEIIDDFVAFKRAPPEEVKNGRDMDAFDLSNCKQKYVREKDIFTW